MKKKNEEKDEEDQTYDNGSNFHFRSRTNFLFS